MFGMFFTVLLFISYLCRYLIELYLYMIYLSQQLLRL